MQKAPWENFSSVYCTSNNCIYSNLVIMNIQSWIVKLILKSLKMITLFPSEKFNWRIRKIKYI